MSCAAAGGADDLEVYGDNRDLEGAVNLVDVKRVGAKRRLHEFQESRHAKKQNVPGTGAETFEPATESVNQEGF